MRKSKNIFSLLIIILTAAVINIYGSGKIALHYSNLTVNSGIVEADWYAEQVTTFELFLIQNKINFEVIYDNKLNKSGLKEFSILILPYSIAMTEEQVLAVEEFLSGGNSVLAFKNSGTKIENGSTTLPEKYFGINIIGKVPNENIHKYHTLLGSNPFSAGIPSGFRFSASTFSNLPFIAKVNSPSTKALGYWYINKSLMEGLPKEELTTGFTFGSYNLGKFTWCGFDHNNLGSGEDQKLIYNKLFSNIINWLNNKPALWINDWPMEKSSAVVISCDVEDKFVNMNNALTIFEEEAVEGQFFILTNVMDEETVLRMAKNGDLGIHGDNHDIFQWQPFEKQLERLSKTKKMIEGVTGRKIISFRPPETAYDENTFKVLHQLGYEILSTDIKRDRAVPYFSDKKMFIVPNTGHDDFDVFIRLKLKDAKAQADRYLADFRRVNEEGGLYTLNYHTQMQCLPEYVEVLRTCIREFKTSNSWITTHNKIRDWWLLKENVKASGPVEEKNGLTFELKNNNNSEVEDLVLTLAGTVKPVQSLMSTTDGAGNVKYSFDPVSGNATIVIKKIAPFQIIKFNLEYGSI